LPYVNNSFDCTEAYVEITVLER